MVEKEAQKKHISIQLKEQLTKPTLPINKKVSKNKTTNNIK